MGFSMHLMGFPGYYGVCLINKHSLVYFENIAVRGGSNMLPFYTWKTEAQESYLMCLMLSSKPFFLKSHSDRSQQQPLTLSAHGTLLCWEIDRRLCHPGVLCSFGRCHALTHTDPSRAGTPEHGLLCPAPSTCLCPLSSFFPGTLPKPCSSFLRLSFQPQSLCLASPSSIPLLLSSVVQTAQ